MLKVLVKFSYSMQQSLNGSGLSGQELHRITSHYTIRARFGCAKRRRFGVSCSNFAAAPRLWAKRLKNSARLSATSPRRGKRSPLKPLQHKMIEIYIHIYQLKFERCFCCESMTEYDRISLIFSWYSLMIFDLGAFLKQILEQCVRLSYVSSQETSMRFRRIELQRDKTLHRKWTTSWKNPWNKEELLTSSFKCVDFSSLIFFSWIIDQKIQEGDDVKHVRKIWIWIKKSRKKLWNMLCVVLPFVVLPEMNMLSIAITFLVWMSLIRGVDFGRTFSRTAIWSCATARDSRAGPRPMHCQSTARHRNTEKPMVSD